MGKETKIGLTVIGLLLGVFGLVVYFKIFRPQPAPDSDVLAAALTDQPSETSAAPPVVGGPKVQLAAAADEQAPVEFAVNDDESPYARAARSSTAASPGAEPTDWSDPPPSSRRRYADEVTAAPIATPDSQGAADEYSWEVDAAEITSAAEAVIDDAVGAVGAVAAEAGARFGMLSDEEVVDEPPGDDPNAPGAIPDRWAVEAEEMAETALPAEEDLRGAVAEFDEPAALHPSEPVHLAPNPVIAAQGRSIQVDAQETVPQAPAAIEPSVAAQPSSAASQDRYSRAASTADPARESPIPSRDVGSEPRTAPAASLPRERAPQRSLPAASPPSAVPSNFDRSGESYTIEPNDNYWRISQKLYGTGAFFKALFEHNRQDYPRADRLRPGDLISAPSIEVLERTYPDLCPRPQHRQVEQKMMRAVSGRKLPRGGAVYVVEEGDTLFDIAKYELGQASRWGELYELNRDLLGEQGDHLKPGMELVLPATTQRESVAGQQGNPIR